LKREADFDLRLLRCFLAVAESRSFSAAAKRLRVAQPWLSQSIQRLERSIDLRLFERSTRSVTLTSAGTALLPHVRRLLNHAGLLADTVRLQREHASGLLRLGTAHFLAELPERSELIEAFASRFPELLLEVRTAWLQRLVDAVLNEEIDAALTTGPLDYPDLDVLVLRRSALEIAVPRGSALARRRQIAPEDLRGQRIGLWKLPEHSPAGRKLSDVLRAPGIKLVHLPDDNFQASLNYAARFGLAIPAPSALLDCARIPAGLVRRALRGDALAIDICLARKAGRSNVGLDALWKVGAELAALRHG
jgi:LysR family transcriptional regulator, benzoate and cis,cis-muconate-responsive activator of ben and cat genes